MWRTVTATGPTCVAANTAATAAIVLGADAPAGSPAPGVAARLVAAAAPVTTRRLARAADDARRPRAAGRMTDGPLLWYLNRGTGVVPLVAAHRHHGARRPRARGRPPGPRLPRFVMQAVHRNVALLSVLTLLPRTSPPRSWTISSTFAGGTRCCRSRRLRTLWLGLGTLALDLLVVVT